jgi:hypothetical protein
MLTPLKYSDAWWQDWRDRRAEMRYRYLHGGDRSAKKVLRRLWWSGCFGMLYLAFNETVALLREKRQRQLDA